MTAICLFSLYAADENSALTLSAMQKKNLLLEYMFYKGFLAEIIAYVKPFGILRRIQSLEELQKLYKPDQNAYTLAKVACRDICHIIQRSSDEDKECLVRLFVRYNVEPVVQNKLYLVQQSLDPSSQLHDKIKANFTSGIKDLFNAFYLQSLLEIPFIEDQEFDILYQQKMEHALDYLSKATFFQASFEIEEPQEVKSLLSEKRFEAEEFDHFLAIAFAETEEIVNFHLKQYDPYCGF
jgi:hypothetical protein